MSSEISQSSIRVPQVAENAGAFLLAVERASPDSPVSLDMLASGGLVAALYGELQVTDNLYGIHDELFDPPFEQRDFAALLKLSEASIANVKALAPLMRSALLGMAVLQFGAAGARIAHDPSVVTVEGGYNTEQAADRAEKLVQDMFEEVLAGRVRGTIAKFPFARMGYPGYLMDTHYDFWTHQGIVPQFPPEIYVAIQKLLPRFPAKAGRLDAHTYDGRPGPAKARERYVTQIQAFQDCLQHDMDGGFKNSAVIGKLTERTQRAFPDEKTEGTLRLEDGPERPLLIVGFPESPYKDDPLLLPQTAAKLERRDRLGGICPARDLVPLERGSEVHKNIQAMSGGIVERLDVLPPLTHEVGGRIYVDPSSLVVNYLLMAIAHNTRG